MTEAVLAPVPEQRVAQTDGGQSAAKVDTPRNATVHDDKHDHWLRWCDKDGNILLTGAKQAAQAQQ